MNKNIYSRIPPQALSQLASQMLDDVRHVYKTTNCRASSEMKITHVSEIVQAAGTHGVVLVGVRRGELRDRLLERLVIELGMTQHKSVSIFGSQMTAVNFVNQLAKAVSGVNNTEALYSGNLEPKQVDGLVSGLTRLVGADIRFKHGAAVELDGFKALAKAATNEQGEGLMIIDNVQSLYRYGRAVPKEVALGGVKSVARDSQVPIIGILKLDESLPLPDKILSRDELRRVELLAQVVDGVYLVSDENGELEFVEPKISANQ